MKNEKGRIAAIILAGGTGKRMGTKIPKQFLRLAGKPVIIYSLQTFSKCAFISDIIVVSHKDYIKRTGNLIKKYKIPKVHKVVKGGSTRQLSSYNGLKACPPGTDYVLIHDAARPFVNDRVINSVFAAAKSKGAAGPAISIDDTIVQVENGCISRILPRKMLKRVQTPQAFKYKLIHKAHEWAAREEEFDFTDDCGLIVARKDRVNLVEGSEDNVKITILSDLKTAQNPSS